ncbi:MAG: PQQ-binding-like beta-propeller repeat protein [Planctomycetes bacterium]|nr:PQQ-binding-like beta-propeller repeat protein [Planctomycetota bacterium]
MDGDGALEVVLAARNEVLVLDGATGALRWKVRANGAVWARPALGDLDGDGRLDLVVGSQDGTLAAVSPGPGAWTMSVAMGSAVVAGPIAVRSADGKSDRVLIGCEDQTLVAMDARTGGLLWRRSYQPAGSEIPLADLDGDGAPEILVQGRDRKFLAVSLASGLPVWSAALEGWAVLPALGADLSGDGVPDVVVATDEPAVIVLSGKDGSFLFRHETLTPALGGLAAGDVTGDGVADLVLGTADGWIPVLAGRGGERVWGFSDGSGPALAPILADLTGDGLPDVLAARTNGSLLAIDGSSGKAVWRDPGGAGEMVAVAVLRGEGGRAHGIAALRRRRVELFVAGSGKSVSSIPLMGPAATASRAPDRDLDGVEDLVVALATGEVLLASGSSGTILWRASPGGAPFAVLFDPQGEGDLLVACHGGEIHGLASRTGHLIWTGRAPSPLDAAPGLLLSSGEGPSLLVAGTKAGEVVAWSRRETSRLRGDASSAYIELQCCEAALAAGGGEAALVTPARAYLDRWPGSVSTPHARLLLARGLLASGEAESGERELRAAVAAGLRSRSLVETVLRRVLDPALLGELAASAPARLVEALGRDLPDGRRQELAKLRLVAGAGASPLERAALLALAADWGQAAEILRGEIDAGPAGAELLAAAGFAAYRAGRFADAESLLSRALAKRHRAKEADYWSRRAALLSDPGNALPAGARILWDLDLADRETMARRLASWAKGAREEDVQRLRRSLAEEAPEFVSRALERE